MSELPHSETKALPRSKWKPIVDGQGLQIGWDTGNDQIRFSSHRAFLRVEGGMQFALQVKKSKHKKARGQK